MTAISITPLSDPIAIVHIPINRAKDYTTNLYWTLDTAVGDAEFINYTSNHIEIAIFAPADLVESEWKAINDPDVQISARWRVFEISSGDEGDATNYDSPHLRHVSAPLAKEGVSILYQSSYFTDFLFVKETDFDRAASIFSLEGWNVSPSQPSRRRSLLSSNFPTPPPTPSTFAHSTSDTSRAPQSTISSNGGITVLPGRLACIGLSPSSEAREGDNIRKLLVWPERVMAGLPPRRGGNGHEGEEDGQEECGVRFESGVSRKRDWSGSGSSSENRARGREDRRVRPMNGSFGQGLGHQGCDEDGCKEKERRRGRWNRSSNRASFASGLDLNEVAAVLQNSLPNRAVARTQAYEALNSAGNGKAHRTIATNNNNNDSPDRPFISYTRTADGVSLLTESRILKSLFVEEREEGGNGVYASDLEDEDEGNSDDDDDDVEVVESCGVGENEKGKAESEWTSRRNQSMAKGEEGRRYSPWNQQEPSVSLPNQEEISMYSLSSSVPLTSPLDHFQSFQHYHCPNRPGHSRSISDPHIPPDVHVHDRSQPIPSSTGGLPRFIKKQSDHTHVNKFDHDHKHNQHDHTISGRAFSYLYSRHSGFVSVSGFCTDAGSHSPSRSRSRSRSKSRSRSRGQICGLGAGRYPSMQGMPSTSGSRSLNLFREDHSGLNDVDDPEAEGADEGEELVLRVRGQKNEKRKKTRSKCCLQLDLRCLSDSAEESFHLDKSGLVTRFSELLGSAKIRMLYASTFHTANILVETGDVFKAECLLARRAGEIGFAGLFGPSGIPTTREAGAGAGGGVDVNMGADEGSSLVRGSEDERLESQASVFWLSEGSSDDQDEEEDQLESPTGGKCAKYTFDDIVGGVTRIEEEEKVEFGKSEAGFKTPTACKTPKTRPLGLKATLMNLRDTEGAERGGDFTHAALAELGPKLGAEVDMLGNDRVVFEMDCYT